MSYWYYVVPVGVTVGISLYAFIRDTGASKTSGLNWLFLVVTGLLWPLTLPFILWKLLLSLFQSDEVEV